MKEGPYLDSPAGEEDTLSVDSLIEKRGITTEELSKEKPSPQGGGSSIQEIYQEGVRALTRGKDADASFDAWLLFEHVFGLDKAWFYAHPETQAKEEEKREYFSLIERRLLHEPLQYLTGEAYFYGERFLVDESVLIPRFDTEVLAEQALEAAKKAGRKRGRILDLCTGSGCVLISVLLSLKEYVGVGSDISQAALGVAGKNVELYGLGERVTLLCGDLFKAPGLTPGFDMITANPPYIARREIEGLSPEVALHEPRLALDGGEDGLDFYRRLCGEAPEYLNPGGVLLMEIGYDQGEAVTELCKKAGFQRVSLVRDLGNKDRVVVASFE